MAFLLAHISDIHLGPLPDVRFVDLMSKRITGYINWKRNRASHMISSTLGEMVDAMQAEKPDHIAVTGDLTNLALDAEIVGAALWLKSLGSPEKVSTIPGNHDAYVRGSLAKSVAAWSANMTGDADRIVRTRSGFPYIRRRGNVAIIGVNSAVATAPFMASGIFGSRHAQGLRQALEKTGEEGLFRVVLIHHPPVRRAATPQKRLYGIGLFQKVVREFGAELILHGHTHIPQRHVIGGIDGSEVPVIGVPAAGQSPGGKKPAAAFNLFRIDGRAGQWKCDLEEHSLTGLTGETAITERRALSG